MSLKRAVFVAFVLSSSFAFAQAGETQVLQPVPGRAQVARSAVVDTRTFFPQVSTGFTQKMIKPFNPTRGLGVASVPSQFNGESSMSLTEGPLVGPKFPGINFTNAVPAAPDVAVGPNHIVQVVNSTIAFYQKNGTLDLAQSANTLYNAVRQTNGPFDPKVMYDRIANRFVIVFLEVTSGGGGISNVLFAISDDSNPNGTWFTYRFNAKLTITGNQYWLDYPGFGYNKDGYVVNGNLFPFAAGGFGGVEFLTVPKTPVLTGAAVTVTSFRDAGGGSAQMAETVDPLNAFVYGACRLATNSTRFYAAQNICDCSGDQYPRRRSDERPYRGDSCRQHWWWSVRHGRRPDIHSDLEERTALSELQL